jgi:ribonuclease-3
LGRQSTTSRPTSSAGPNSASALGLLIDKLPRALAEEALTHPYWSAGDAPSYERLEFLGDAVLDVAIARHLYLEHPDFDEGQMTRVLAHVRSRVSCAGVAQELDLGRRLRAFAEGIEAEQIEELSGNPKVQAAVVEAALGALFLDLGLEAIEDAIVAAFSPQIAFALQGSFDSKTELMELLGKEGKTAVYQVESSEGPPHNRTFVCSVLIDGAVVGTGSGKRKKDAEQAAAREALGRLHPPAAPSVRGTEPPTDA